MSYIILALLFILSGFFMKYSDDLFDVNHNLVFASILGVVCGVSSGLAAVYSNEAAYIFMAIAIGNILALKVDGIHHIITFIIFICILLICGIPNMSLVILLICILAALSDEIGHELIHKFTQNRFLNLFFEYRFVMKIVILLLAVCGVFNIWTFVCFILFELSYLFAELFLKVLIKKIS
ncbi:MAG: hypothetical protein UHW99_01600 [Methanobrevibacter sp.]|nr:hypothetical protein [Methanobrevibacter sp.]